MKILQSDQGNMDNTCEQVGGTHYSEFAIQPLEYITANQMSFIEGSVVKYVTRWRYKGGVEDLRKAVSLLAYLIDSEERKL